MNKTSAYARRIKFGLQPQDFTNANLNSGYACNLSGTLGGSQVVGVAQFRPQGDGTFGAAALRLHVGRGASASIR